MESHTSVIALRVVCVKLAPCWACLHLASYYTTPWLQVLGSRLGVVLCSCFFLQPLTLPSLVGLPIRMLSL